MLQSPIKVLEAHKYSIIIILRPSADISHINWKGLTKFIKNINTIFIEVTFQNSYNKFYQYY